MCRPLCRPLWRPLLFISIYWYNVIHLFARPYPPVVLADVLFEGLLLAVITGLQLWLKRRAGVDASTFRVGFVLSWFGGLRCRHVGGQDQCQVGLRFLAWDAFFHEVFHGGFEGCDRGRRRCRRDRLRVRRSHLRRVFFF